MFNLIARRIDRIRVRVTLKSHRQRVNRWESSGSGDRRFESFLASQPSEHEMTPGARPTGVCLCPVAPAGPLSGSGSPPPAAEDAIHPRRCSLEHRQAISADALRPCSGVRSTRTRPWPTVRRPRPSRSATTSYPVDRAPLQVEGSIHHKFNTDQIALRTIERVDGDLLDTDSIRYLVNAAVESLRPGGSPSARPANLYPFDRL